MDFLFVLILIIGACLGFFVQSIIGFSGSIIAFPFLLLVLSLQDAIAFLTPIIAVFSVIMILRTWKDINWKVVGSLAIGIIPGFFLGVYILKIGDPIILKKLLGVFILLYVGYVFAKKKKVEIFKKMSLIFGFGGGFFSGLFNTGGPFIVTFIFNKVNKANIVRATIIGTFGITNFTRIPALFYAGMLRNDLILMSLFTLPFCLLAIYLGDKSYNKINEKTFKNILLGFLLISGIYLIVN